MRKRFQQPNGREMVQIKFSVEPEVADLFDRIAQEWHTVRAVETFRRLVVDEAARLSLPATASEGGAPRSGDALPSPQREEGQ